MTMEPENKNRFMLVLSDRVYYTGLLGKRMKTRALGAVSIYLAPSGSFRLKTENCEWTTHDMAIVPAYQKHQIVSDCGSIINVLVEPERLAEGELDHLIEDVSDATRRVSKIARLRRAATQLREFGADCEVSTETFDQIVFGRPLGARRLDRRIVSVLRDIEMQSPDSQMLASDFAESVGLSSSRFLHLFKEQTGLSFRNYRMWRRARTFLIFANQTSNLTNVALDLGYPDSSHFSHSIRKTYGLQPRSIRVGSRDLSVDSRVQFAAGY